MVQNCKVKEIISFGNSCSWGGWRYSIRIQCKLDRSFGNDEWFNLFPRSKVEYMDLWASDHGPIKTCFALEGEAQGRGRFYFDKRMVKKEGFEEVVHRGWCMSSESELSVMDRIFNCRREISKWKKVSDLNSKDKIVRLQALLEKEVAKIAPDYCTMQSLKRELSEAYREEEVFWRQKSREQWLKSGDMNTKFFHNSVKGKKIQNKVLMLLDDANQEHFSEGSKGNIVVEYFRNLFMSSNPFDLQSLFQGFESRVSPEMNTRLTATVSTDEIKRVAFVVKGSSAPGEDGLTGVFYQKYWHIVGPALTTEIQLFFETANMSDGWNHTQLCLLPKVIKPTKMKDMRPISLCPVQYKIISKILCDRLKPLLPSIISDTQGAFVSGRLISDNIIIAHEMVYGLQTNDKVAENFMAIKTDMSKAYDHVEWCFLETLLENLGFDRVWIRWVMACVSTVSFSVLLNGRSHGFIKLERGIRQGNPLSPFLFILCAEALISCLNQAEVSG